MFTLTKKNINLIVLTTIGAGVALFIYLTCRGDCNKRKRDGFTRTCLTGDTSSIFARSPVDYAYEDITVIPQKEGMRNPHWMGDVTDKKQPLDHGPVDLIRDEKKLIHPELLWEQYGNNYKGCGNGMPYIVNDDKTRFALEDVGDHWATTYLYSLNSPQHHVGNIPALTDEDIAVHDPYDRLYGDGWLPNQIGV